MNVSIVSRTKGLEQLTDVSIVDYHSAVVCGGLLQCGEGKVSGQ